MKWKKEVREIIEEGIDDFDAQYDFDYDDDYDWESEEHFRLCTEINYKYIDKNIKPPYELDDWGGIYHQSPRWPRLSQIDMNSIYDKQTFRKKQIERVLGIEKETMTTLGDLYENSKRT